MDAATFVAGLPKAELHMHIEGSIEPGMMIALAARNGVGLPWRTEAEIRDAYAFENLQQFLDLYYAGCRVLVTAADFRDVTAAYLERAHADRVLHAEMFLGPQAHTSRGIALTTMLGGVLDAMREAEQRLGITSGLIVVAQRHKPEEEALQLLADLAPWYPRLLGFGLGGAEVGHPPAKFRRFFERCRALGFRRVAHAGEEGPADYVRDSVALLGVDRIDHGNACIDDPSLVGELARSRIPLTMCPLSNLALRVVESVADHPLKRLLARGVCVTVNSDDPAYFGGYVNDNLIACAAALGLSNDELAQLACNSFEAAFLPDDRRRAGLAAIDCWRAQRAVTAHA